MNSPSVSPAAAIGTALLISDDPTTISQISECMGEFAVTTEPCGDVPTALQMLSRRKFEVVLVDFKLGEQVHQVLQQIRSSSSNKTAVTFAIKDDSGKVPLLTQGEANFIIDRPLSTNSVGNILKVAYGLIVRERRRYFRCPLTTTATVKQKNTQERNECGVFNISEGGIALNLSSHMNPGTQVEVQFTLPGAQTTFTADAEICWNDKLGRAGLHFLGLTHRQKGELQGWLSGKLEQSLPESVVRKFIKV